MKRCIFLALVLLTIQNTLAQKKEVQLYFSLANNLITGIHNRYDLVFNEKMIYSLDYYSPEIRLGVKLDKPKSIYNIGLSYNFHQNFPKSKIFSNKEKFNSNYVGVSFEVTLGSNKLIRPFIGNNIQTMIATNYINKNVTDDNSFPNSIILKQNYYSNDQGPKPIIVGYSAHQYLFQNIPFINNVYSGIRFFVLKNFTIDISLGYMLRIVRSKYVYWEINPWDQGAENEKYNQAIQKSTASNYSVHNISYQFGLSYSIPLKKKAKQTE